MAAALLLFCGATINTVGEYKLPLKAVPPTDRAPSVGEQAHHVKLISPNVHIASAEQSAPNVDLILHNSVWAIEMTLLVVALLLIAIVAGRFFATLDCCRRGASRLQRLPLNLARQKAERTGRARKNE